MVKILYSCTLILLLASCKSGTEQTSRSTESSTSTLRAAAISTQNVDDDRVGKQVFANFSTASDQRSESFGSYARGCQAGALQLQEDGPTWQAMRLSRNRNWGQPVMMSFVEDLSQFAATMPGWDGLYVGDMSQPRGGPTAGHASHQIGLDVDIWFLPPNRLDLSRQEREELSSLSLRRARGAFINDNWTPQHAALLKAAASDPRVGRIFVFPGAKVELCNSTTGDRSWLNKVRPWFGHYSHFHVRLNCPPGAENCESQAPPPPGDGCADAQVWVDNILNPPPPQPNPNPRLPRGPLTMANLPAQCQSVAAN